MSLAPHANLEEIVQRLLSPKFLARFQHIPSNSQEKIVNRWRHALKRLVKLGRVSFGNKVTVLKNGDEAFEEMWKAVQEARNRVVMVMYTIAPDMVGERTIQTLTTARKSGSEVTLIYDDVGSVSLPRRALQALRIAGGTAFAFNPIFTWPWQRARTLLHRNHRKIVAIDEKIGFIGGMNISEKYAGPKVGGTGYFQDMQVKVEGPAATHLTHVAYDSLRVDPSVSINIPTLQVPSLPSVNDEGMCVQVLESNVMMNKPEIQQAFRTLLRTCSSHCYITTPYFLPPRWLKRAIIKAAKRGVDIRIITAGSSDVPVVRFAAQHIYSAFLRRGVRIYEMFGSALHAKTCTADGLYNCIGSFNLDLWSGGGNLEANIVTFDPDMAILLEQQFKDHLKLCKEVTIKDINRRPYILRFIHWLTYHSLRLFRPPKLKSFASAVVKSLKHAETSTN